VLLRKGIQNDDSFARCPETPGFSREPAER